MSERLAQIQAAYNKYLQTADLNTCAFCEQITSGFNEIINEYTNFYVIKNRFPYYEWDAQIVTEHYMIIPKRHVMRFDEFTTEETAQFLDIISGYEVDGYSIYARAQQNKSRTITHQHTHLLRLAK